jgi:UDP-glucose:(heptosyl)LPS alpha-1,3-glucosyltransferase
MKIGVVIPKYGLVGGAESFSYELTERLALRDGLEVHVFANKWRQGKSPVIFHKVSRIGFPRFLRQISFAYSANRKILSTNCDLIHSHDRIFCADIFTMHGIPHSTWIKEARRKHLSLFDRSLIWLEKKTLENSRMHAVLPVSTLVRDELLKSYNIPESRLEVVHPGISEERFSGLDRQVCRNVIRSHHGLSEKDIVILFVGMNFEIKRLDLVIRGTAELIAKDKRFQCLKVLAVGKGETKRYQTLANDLGISGHIIFAGVSSDVEKYYLAGDIFAMPSVFDTFGIAVLEAMFAGLPIIISSKVGAKDLMESGVQGFVLGENPDIFEFSRCIEFLIINENRMKMGENARKTAESYTWDRVADKVYNLYMSFFGKEL